MRKRSRGRIQKYLYNTKDAVKNSPLYCNDTIKHLDQVFNEFYAGLKRDDFFGGYFDRLDQSGKSLCDKMGEFSCQGLWNKDACSYIGNELVNSDHKINPYASKESRVIFSMWNLDHRFVALFCFFVEIFNRITDFFPQQGRKIETSYSSVDTCGADMLW